MSELEYSGCGKLCAELDRAERAKRLGNPHEIREAVRLNFGKCAVIDDALEKMSVPDFHYLYNVFKVVATQLLGAGRIDLRAPLSRARAAELIGKSVIPYFVAMHDRADGDIARRRTIIRYGVLIAVNMHEVVGIFVEACHDAQIDFVRGDVRREWRLLADV